jgi:hypothetical protein
MLYEHLHYLRPSHLVADRDYCLQCLASLVGIEHGRQRLEHLRAVVLVAHLNGDLERLGTLVLFEIGS